MRSPLGARTSRRAHGAQAFVALAVSGIVAGLLLHKLAGQDPHTWMIDLRVYLLGAQHAFAANLYDQQYPVASLPFTYPPFAAMVMAPLAHLPFGAAAAVVTMLSLGALMLITRRVISRASSRAWWFIPVTVMAIVVEPVWATFSFGQINLVVVALCLLDLTGRHRARGVLTGLAAGLKLTPLFFVAYLVVTRQFRAAAVAVATFAATVAVGFVFNPHGAWVFWTDAMFDSSRVGSAFFSGNQALTGVLPRWAGEPLPHAAVLAAQALAGVAALAAAAYLHRRGRELESVIAASFGMLAMSPISWSHHWVWAWPAALVLAAALAREIRGLRGPDRETPSAHGSKPPAPGREAPTPSHDDSARRASSSSWGWALATGALLALWVTVFISRSIWGPPHYEDVELSWNLGQKVFGNTYAIAGAVWVVWAVLDARRSRVGKSPQA